MCRACLDGVSLVCISSSSLCDVSVGSPTWLLQGLLVCGRVTMPVFNTKISHVPDVSDVSVLPDGLDGLGHPHSSATA